MYQLKSTKDHGSYVMDYRGRARQFNHLIEAWLFIVKHRKWHWRVVRQVEVRPEDYAGAKGRP